MKSNKASYNLASDCIDKNGESILNKHKIALITVNESEKIQKFTYSQLMGLSNRLADSFRQLKMPMGSRLLIRLPNEVEFPITFIAAIKAGLIPIPSSPLYQWSELRFLFENSQCQTLVTNPQLLPKGFSQESLSNLKNLILVGTEKEAEQHQGIRWQDLLKTGDAQNKVITTQANDPAYWLYTSGTTGVPKAAIHAHRSIRAHDQRAEVWQDVRAGDVVFNTSALNWSYALTAGLLDVWRHGLCAVIYNGPPKHEKILKIIARLGVSTFMSVPGIYHKLLLAPEPLAEAFRGVRVCLSAGECLAPVLKKQFHELTELPIQEGLGMTENSVYLVQKYGQPTTSGSIGQSVFGDQIKIIREDGKPAEPNQVGSLATHQDCEGLMLGYHDAASQSIVKAAQESEWFLSGDLAKQDELGNFFFIGRRDDILTIGGYRIAPLEIEKTIQKHPIVSECAISGITIENKTLLQANIVLTENAPPEAEAEKEIMAYAKTQLAKYKIPRKTLFVNSLPKTVTGKLIRKALLTSP